MVGYSVSLDGDLTGNNGESDVWVVQLGPWDETAVNDINHPDIHLFPNPATKTLQVKWTGPTPQALEVLDITGRLVYGPVQPDQLAQGGFELSVAGWPAGLYTLRMQSTSGRSVQRFVKE